MLALFPACMLLHFCHWLQLRSALQSSRWAGAHECAAQAVAIDFCCQLIEGFPHSQPGSFHPSDRIILPGYLNARFEAYWRSLKPLGSLSFEQAVKQRLQTSLSTAHAQWKRVSEGRPLRTLFVDRYMRLQD